MIALLALATALIPVVPLHGTVLAPLPNDRAVVRTDAIGDSVPEATRTYAIRAKEPLHAGEEIDGFARRDNGGWHLDDVVAADAFVAGLPNKLVSHVVDVGDPLPAITLVDQRGAIVRTQELRGKTVLMSFAFTRCPDAAICPAVTAKFAYLAHHLDPKTFHLIEVTLDPLYDSPAVLRDYGAKFGADPTIWTLATGQGAQIKTLIDEVGISSVLDRPGKYVHDEMLIVADANGTIRQKIPAAGWNPDDVVATARDTAGLASNPLRRLELAAIAGVVAACGGAISTSGAILESLIFLLGVVILGSILVYWGRIIFTGK